MIIEGIEAIEKNSIKFAISCFKELTLLLEGPILLEKLNFTELYVDNCPSLQILFNTIWSFLCRPYNYLTKELSHWVKRLIFRFYGQALPKRLQNLIPPKHLQQISFLLDYQLQADQVWQNSEKKLCYQDLILKKPEQVFQESEKDMTIIVKPPRSAV